MKSVKIFNLEKFKLYGKPSTYLHTAIPTYSYFFEQLRHYAQNESVTYKNQGKQKGGEGEHNVVNWWELNN